MKISILQIPHADNHVKYLFMDSDFALENGFSILHYKTVYTYEKTENIWLDDQDTLNEVFTIFNVQQPEDYRGRSVSVSDIIMIDNRMYYVDDIGFKKVID